MHLRLAVPAVAMLGLFISSLTGVAQAESLARTAADLERDQRERPQEIMAFAGIQKGMQVADLFAGGGYYSELLQQAVGDEGHVLLYNNGPYHAFGAKGLEARFADGRLARIEQRVADAADMGLAPASLDRVIMVMAFHDLYYIDDENGWPAIDHAGFIEQISRALKPGGALLIVDHAAPDGSADRETNRTHRIDEAFARARIEAKGLHFEASSDLLRNPDDARDTLVFDETIKGKTDRFVHLYRKPN